MKSNLAALISGVIFGLGLCVSEMINPTRVIGFLDLLGSWDATLLFVMLAAVAVTGIGFPLVLKRANPLLAEKFFVPERSDIDFRLIAGSVIFGIGWGLAGLCPGPAIAALASLSPSILMFVVAMAVGQWIASRFER
ncbi:MAG: YeeE/YedE family protein [Burkholderiales bacterium]|nr:YeeE/YedE family protein [Burkholderiales bacterium]